VEGANVLNVDDMFSEGAAAVLKNEFPFPEPKVPVRYNFDQGVPAPELYPLDDLSGYVEKALKEFGSEACEYFGDVGYSEMVYGYDGLRETLAARITKRDGRPQTKDGVMLVNGSSHGLAMIAQAFLGKGDGAVVEALSFPFMVDYMDRTGAEIATVPVDESGMVVDALPAALQSLKDRGVRPKFIYTVATFQVPTGTLLPLDRRERLIEIAKEWDIFIIEDNCYYDLYFETPPPPTLRSLDDSGRVIQTDSFSKIVAPGLRLGWVAGPPEAIKGLAAVRQDLGSSQLLSHAMDLYLKDGKLESRLEKLRPANKAKRDIALKALQTHCADYVTYVIPQGGIYFWLQVRDDIDCAQVSEKLMMEGVACRPGERFTNDPSGHQFLRLAFLHVPADEIERGIAALGEALKTSGPG
jgi:2-aminoadipate transaminase